MRQPLRRFSRRLAFCGALLTFAPLVAAEPTPEAVAEARAAFDRGNALLADDRPDAALAEFERSRTLARTRGNTRNAAVCLEKLGRLDEALDRLEELVRDFPPTDEAQKQVLMSTMSRLAGLVGQIELRVDKPGARVVVDGRERGTAPLAAPLRVPGGTHAVRVFLPGHAPFEDRVVVAGGQRSTLDVKLPALERVGRVRVSEQANEAADVLVDGIVVGPAPWEGALPPGRHTLGLRAVGKRGTPPTRVDVLTDDTRIVTLSLVELRAALTIDPTPRDATVALDGVALGIGPWQGPVTAGTHRVEIAAEGFLPQTREIAVPLDGARTVTSTLERDPLSPLWGKRARARVIAQADLDLVVPLAGHGGATGNCAFCTAGVGARIAALYALPTGLRVGLEVGLSRIAWDAGPRDLALAVGPARDPATGTARDALKLQTYFASAVLGFGREGVPLEGQLAVGGALGSVDDARAISVGDAAPQAIAQRPDVRALRMALDLAYVRRFLDGRLALRGGASLSALVPLTDTTFAGARSTVVDRRVGSLAVPEDERLLGGVVLAVSPHLGASMAF